MVEPREEGGWGVVFETDDAGHPVPTVAIVPVPGAVNRVSFTWTGPDGRVETGEVAALEPVTRADVLVDLPEVPAVDHRLGLLTVEVAIEDPATGEVRGHHKQTVLAANVDGEVSLWTEAQAETELVRPSDVSTASTPVPIDLSTKVVVTDSEPVMSEEDLVEEGTFGMEVTR